MRRLVVLLGILATTVLAACSKNSDGSGDSGGGVAGQCAIGQVISSVSSTCMNRGNCVDPQNPSNLNIGFDTTVNACVPGTYVSSNYYSHTDLRFENVLSVTNSTVFTQLIQDYSGGCNWTWLIGGPNYSYYENPSYMDIEISSIGASTAQISIGLGTNAPDSYTPAAGVIAMTATVWDINTSSTSPGVDMQANGSFGSCSWNAVGNAGVDVQVSSQTFSAPYMDATVSYRGQVFAHAHLISY